MLNKKICQMCHVEHGEEWSKWKDEEWSKGWETAPEKVRNNFTLAETDPVKRHLERLMRAVSRSSSRIKEAPPAWCPYVLKHVFSSSEA